jgi:lysozyme
MGKIYLSILLFIFISFTLNSYINSKPLKIENKTNETKYYYNEVINNLKNIEGFRNTWYKCSADKETIGYGITKGLYKELDNLNFIDEKTAEKYLIKEFNKCLSIAEKDGLSKNKALAIASFIYNVGPGNYKRSTLRKLLKENKSIDKEIIKWVHIKGKFSKGLMKRRKYELKIFKNE